ncbi:hypothetical protein ACU8MT_24720 (plasmid) [Rhizobium leguminosarum]
MVGMFPQFLVDISVKIDAAEWAIPISGTEITSVDLVTAATRMLDAMHTVRGSPTRVSARRNAWKDTALLEHCREIWQEAVENAGAS